MRSFFQATLPQSTASLSFLLPCQVCCASAVQYCSLPWASCDLQPPHQPVLTLRILGWESSHTTTHQLRVLLLKHIQPEGSLPCILPRTWFPTKRWLCLALLREQNSIRGILPIIKWVLLLNSRTEMLPYKGMVN